jgi:hypothetical protein
MAIEITKRTSGGYTIEIEDFDPVYVSSLGYTSNDNGIRIIVAGKSGQANSYGFAPADWTIQGVTGFETNLQVADALDGLGVVSTKKLEEIKVILAKIEDFADDIEDHISAIEPNQINGTQKTQTVDPAGINSESIIRTFGLTITRPANTTEYTANDVIGDVSGEMPMFANVAKAAGYGIAILGVRAQTNDTGLAGKALNISFYNSALTTVIADNEPFVMVDDNAEKREGNVTLTFGSGILAKVAQNLDERIVLNPAARSIGCVPVTTGGHTPSANSTWIKLYIKCLLTN